MKYIPIGLIRANTLDNSKVHSFALLLEDGRIFPPIKVDKLHDGTYIIKDGRHRYSAMRSLGWLQIPAITERQG